MTVDVLSYLIECLVCGIAFLIFYHLVLAREKSFGFNRAYLLVSMVLCLTLPLVEIHTEAGGGGNMSTIYLPEVINVSTDMAKTGDTSWNWTAIASGAYLLVGLILFIRLILGLLRIGRSIRKSEVKHKSGYTLVWSEDHTAVSTFFHYVFWNNQETLSDRERELVLKHELTHVRQYHSVDLVIVNLLAVCFWVLPIWRFYRRALEETHEYLADHEVLRNTDPQIYGSLIARYTLEQSGLSLTHSFANQSLKRITMMKNTLNSIKPMKMLMALPLAVLIFWTVSCEEADISTEEAVSTSENLPTTDTDENITAPGDEEVFSEVDERPDPVGGFPAFVSYMQDNLAYPSEAKDQEVEGKVFVQFIVAKDGSISEVKAIKGIGHGCDTEAVRIISEMPDWKPGIKDGEPVNVRMVLPVNFELQ